MDGFIHAHASLEGKKSRGLHISSSFAGFVTKTLRYHTPPRCLAAVPFEPASILEIRSGTNGCSVISNTYDTYNIIVSYRRVILCNALYHTTAVTSVQRCRSLLGIVPCFDGNTSLSRTRVRYTIPQVWEWELPCCCFFARATK